MTCVRKPTPSGVISSGYGIRPGRTTREPRLHAGIDLSGRRGDPIKAAVPATVETIVHDNGTAQSVFPGVRGRAFRGYGNVVIVKQLDGTWASYNHLDSIAVRPGMTIPAGTLIGRMGNTSNGKFPGMGVHLHFEIRRERPGFETPFPAPYGTYNVDPARWMRVLGANVQNRITIPSSECDVTAVAARAANPSAFADAFIRPGDVDIDWELVAEGQPPIQKEGEEYEPPFETRARAAGLVLGIGAAVIGLAWLFREPPGGVRTRLR